jgi:replicative DNA helicase
VTQNLASLSIEAEQSVLGAILIDAKANHGAVEFTEADHFTTDSHRAIWCAIDRALTGSQDVDMFSIAQSLESFSELQMVGGMEYLNDICEGAHSVNPVLVRQYWKVLDDHRTRRRAEAAAMAVLESVRSTRDIDEMLDNVQQQLNSVSTNVNSDTVTINKALDTMLARMDELQSLPEGQMIGITTGIKALDELTMGYETGLHVIAARPGMGKTVLAMQGAVAAAKEGLGCLVISLEMPSDQLTQRCTSAVASLNFSKMKDPRLMNDEDWPKLVAGVNIMKDMPIEFLDRMDSKLSRITQTIRAWHRRTSRPGLVVIDYLQLMVSPGGHSENEAISEITRRLKMLSNELDIPIILVSQLNRSLEQRPNKRPIPSDLRSSGSIEQDADTITFLYRDEIYNDNSPYPGIVELCRAKQRSGPIGTVYAGSELHFMRFSDLFNYEHKEAEPEKRGRY